MGCVRFRSAQTSYSLKKPLIMASEAKPSGSNGAARRGRRHRRRRPKKDNSSPMEALRRLAEGKMALDAWQNERLRQVGYYEHYVVPHDTLPQCMNAHTHGFPTKCNHPDLQIVYPLSEDVLHSVFVSALSLIEKSKLQLEDGGLYHKILRGYTVLVRSAVESGRPVRRLIMPDADGTFSELQCADLPPLASAPTLKNEPDE